MTRTNARELAVHLIYEMNTTGVSADEALCIRFAEDYYPTLAEENEIYSEKPGQKQLAYIRAAALGVSEKREELDGYIRRYAIGWRIERISSLARAVMELAIYEILYVGDVPTSAAINEAVELTRRYEAEDVVSFVNGILGSFAREQGQAQPQAPEQEQEQEQPQAQEQSE